MGSIRNRAAFASAFIFGSGSSSAVSLSRPMATLASDSLSSPSVVTDRGISAIPRQRWRLCPVDAAVVGRAGEDESSIVSPEAERARQNRAQRRWPANIWDYVDRAVGVLLSTIGGRRDALVV